MKLEKKCHQESQDSIKCFRKVIKTDEKSVKAVEILSCMYPPPTKAKNAIAVLSVLPLLIRLLSLIYDQASDVKFAHRYHNMHTREGVIESRLFDRYGKCDDYLAFRHSHGNRSSFRDCLTSGDYKFAEYYIYVSLAIMMVLNSPMTYKK